MNRWAATKPLSGPVLIVDDERGARNLLSTMLSDCGIACRTAPDAGEALGLLEREPVAAILTDLEMPGLSGMELLARVRPRFPNLAFLVVTGVDDVRVGIEAMRKGADDYLVKPLEIDVVLTSIERAIERNQLREEVEKYRERLEQLVEQRTLELRSALEELEQSYGQTLRALAAAVDLRDSSTAGHSHRVALYSLRIAAELALDAEEQKTIEVGAWLHDIGKLAIPDGILLKPGALNETEWRVMRSHVEIGYGLVRQIPFLRRAAEIILTHHERSDGSGYPKGLQGPEIPCGARIFAIADTVDAMTSDRPYRSAHSFADASNEIRTGSGGRYDRRAAEAFLSLPSEVWEEIRLRARTMTAINGDVDQLADLRASGRSSR
jgi:putative nucleotidyltransferase with HDIG domain